jgi:hypothetical protein
MRYRHAAAAVPVLLTYLSAGAIGLFLTSPAVSAAQAVAADRAEKVANSITITNRSPDPIRRYPLQFGRPFVKGAIPNAPEVLLNGRAIPTQADVKNRYPDGSVAFAVIAVVIPELQPRVEQILTFENTTGNRNTPLTRAQMLDPAYNFNAVMRLVGGTPARGGKVEATQVINHWPTVPITNGGFTISVNGAPRVVAGINLVGVRDVNAVMQAAIAKVIPGAVFEGAAGGQGRAAIQAPPGVALSYTTPPPNGQDMGAAYNLTRSSGATLTPPVAGREVTGTASARTMLENGNYKLWTSGPVAQTIMLADDTPTHKYDIGFGDGYTPFRPRFYATFWPATHQVFVRAVGENGLSTELEDLGYSLTLTGANAVLYTNSAVVQPAMSTWTKSFWLGGTPNPEVNIDNNLAYLESTRFVPNYDPSIQMSQATIASDYASWWTGTSHDIDGYGAWQPAMGATGARPDIGPEPSWDVAWLYTGDWRLRQTALGNADLAAQWPVNVRETDPAMRLNRTDPVPAAGQVGSGYGYPISVTDRKTLGPASGGEADFLYYNSDNSSPPNKLDVVGRLVIGPSGADASGWTFDEAHEPAAFFIPYILTGDPFYLEELENWAAYDVFANQGSQRGPTGDEGMTDAQLRGAGWLLRSRAEAAFAIPDADPFKTYLTILTEEDIAAWEGALRVADPVLGGTSEYAWAKTNYGDPESSTEFGRPPPAPALHNWEANIDGNVLGGAVYARMWSPAVAAWTSPWMQWYTQYALGRAAELGFAAAPLTRSTGQYLTGMIDRSGHPKMIASYHLPVAQKPGGMIASWPGLVAALDEPWLTGADYTGGSAQGAVPTSFTQELYDQGYDMYASAALALLVDEHAPGAVQAESWIVSNVYRPLIINGGLATDPSWAIVPRTDHNSLPPEPTSPQ